MSTDGSEIPGTRMNARTGQVLDVATCAQISHPDVAVDPVVDPGFGVDPAVATFQNTGYTTAECEVNPWDMFPGVLLNGSFPVKKFEQ